MFFGPCEIVFFGVDFVVASIRLSIYHTGSFPVVLFEFWPLQVALAVGEAIVLHDLR